MQFIAASDWDAGIDALTMRLSQELSKNSVLWLVSGGSNLPASIEIMHRLDKELTANLTIMLNDERYGQPGHADSNWHQLLSLGVEGKQAKLLPILEGRSWEETVIRYNALAEQAFADNDMVISQLGMGADGHVAGILPGTPAASEGQALAVGYESPPYTRLTLTFPALKKVNAAYVMLFGEAKRQALENLKTDLPLDQQPAQILKQLPEAYIYSDLVET